jgi:predicted dehydrogenase
MFVHFHQGLKKGNHMRRITLLGTGFIGNFYTMTLLGMRNRDEVRMVCGATMDAAREFAQRYDIPRWTDSIEQAVNDPETDLVVIGLPNYLHKEGVLAAAKAKKAVMCTKPLGCNAADAREMLLAVEEAGIFAGYLEDLVYTPKTLKAIEAVKNGAIGRVLWTRSREAHPGPHSDWFLRKDLAGGGAIVDMGCHCIEIGRNFIGKDVRPLEVMCWADTQVHPIETEDHAIGLIKYSTGAISQFEVSWNFRGGMDLRDEVSGTEGTIWLNHWLRTGIEMFTSVGEKGYVAEKAESDKGWLFPVGDEVHALGYAHMFADQLNALDQGAQPIETFYDGYVVNAIMDACYLSAQTRRWEPVQLDIWRGEEKAAEQKIFVDYDENYYLIKEEKMPDGKTKLILKDKKTGEAIQRVRDTSV